VITTLVPAGPLAGENEVSVGGLVTVKSVALGVSPEGVSTRIGPVAACAGTTAVAVVSLTKAQVAAASGSQPPASNVTPVIPVKPVPVIVTVSPGTPLVGENDVTVEAEAGSAVTSAPSMPSASARAVALIVILFLGFIGRFMDGSSSPP